MKKISTLLLAAAAMAFSASADELTPLEVTLANPSFEENTLDGWSTQGAAWNDVNWYAMQNRNKSWTNGNYGIRSAADIDIEGANYMYQTLTSQSLGTYVFTVDGQFARTGWKGNIGAIEGAHGFVFVCDDMGDPENPGTADEPADGITAVYGTNMSNGDTWFLLYRFYVVHTTSADLEDFGETSLTVGFGYPADCPAVSKARICCDNFTLRYFDTTDTDAVKDFVNAEIEDIKAGKYSIDQATPMGIENYSGPVDTVLSGFVSNTGYSVDTAAGESGISNIVAPAAQDNKYYNLQGIEIAKPTTAGLYIHNGKKFIVK